MTLHFTKSEIASMFKEFLYVMGSDLPEGCIKSAWHRYMEVKRQDKWKADMDALVDEGFLEAVTDETTGEWRYELTGKGATSPEAEEWERIV